MLDFSLAVSVDNGYAEKNILAVRMHGNPTQASQVILPRVRILLNRNPGMAAITTNTAVQRAWVETALSPMEIPRIPEPALKM